MNKNVVVFILSLCCGFLAEEYSIQRRVVSSGFDVNGDRIWNVLRDRFVLPRSKCSAGNVSVQCTNMGGVRVSNKRCTCECKEEKSTFGLYNSWKCIENSKFHNLSGKLLDLGV